METTIPVSIAVLGHPLLERVTIAWSATAGMVPQTLLFTSEGGHAEAILTSQEPQSESIRYQAQVTFATSQPHRSAWSIQTNRVIPVNAGGDAIAIDLRRWVHYLVLQFQDDVEIRDRSDTTTDISTSNTDHLVVNLIWQGTHLSTSVKCSQRMAPNTSWEIPYICPPEDCQISANLSAFGVIDRQLVRLPAQPIDPTQSPLSLCARHNKLQLIA